MWKKRAAALLTAAVLMGSATAQAELEWQYPLRQLPEDLVDAYRAQDNPQLLEMAEFAIGALGIAPENVDRREDSILAQEGEEDSGERMVIYWKPSRLKYSHDTQHREKMSDLDAALAETEAFVKAMLGTDAFMQGDVRVEEYMDGGEVVTNIIDFVWDKYTEQEIMVHDLKLTATFSDGGVRSVILWDALLEPVETGAEYCCKDPHKALDHLNYAIAHIDPAHTCTSFDDPADTLARVYPVYTQMFSQEELYTPAWAFVLKDAQHGALKTPVLVDMVSGDVWDYHDGRMAGEQ